MKYFILTYILIINPSSYSRELGVPEDYGVSFDEEYFENKIQNENFVKSTGRINLFLLQCKDEARLQTKCTRIEKLEYPCNEKQNLEVGKVDYCVNVESNQITINKKFNIRFRSATRVNKEFPPKPRAMFYSALNCMKAVYKQYNINLNLTINEVQYSKQADITIFERLSGDHNLHKIYLGNHSNLFSHSKLCLLVTHEFAHHLGLPDRYEYRNNKCPLARVYKPGTVMSSKSSMGFKALSFLEEDFFIMMQNACPDTVRGYQKFQDHPCPKSIKLIPSDQEIFINHVKDILKSLFSFNSGTDDLK